ncbi:MAG: TRAP transporter substrate-binding protein DctP [Rhodobacteraceae bacterium]|nr:TRAP transporter substrate-binding protein DctP [Paracoccaceae bacterium]
MTSLKTALLAATAATGLLTGTAMAQDVTIRVAHVFPATHWLWAQAGEIFANQVTERTNGRIAFEIYPAGQLGRETATAIQNGVADAGVVVPSYEAAVVPLTSVLELPGLHSTACEATARNWTIASEGGALYENEYAPLGLRPLYVNVLTPYQLMTNTAQVTNLDQVAGLKLRANGAAMSRTARAIGAVAVTVTSSETYDSLARGTIDGAFWPIGSTYEVGLENVLNYTIRGTQLGGGATFFAISEELWESLSAEDQQIMMDAGMAAQQHLCHYLDDLDASVEARMLSEGTLTITELSPEEQARWSVAVASVADEWVAEMESTGRPGAAVLEAYRTATPGF